MDADAISYADDQADVVDSFHVVHNEAGHSWTLVVPPEQSAAGAMDLTTQLGDGSHWWDQPAEPEAAQGGFLTLRDPAADHHVRALSRRDELWRRPRQDVGDEAGRLLLVAPVDGARDEGTVVGDAPPADAAARRHLPAEEDTAAPRGAAVPSSSASAIFVHGGRRPASPGSGSSSAGLARRPPGSVSSSRSKPPRPRASSSASSGVGIGGRAPRRAATRSDSSSPAAVRAAVDSGGSSPVGGLMRRAWETESGHSSVRNDRRIPPPWGSGTPGASATRCRVVP